MPQKAKPRLYTLSGNLEGRKDEADLWKRSLEKLETGGMPPKGALRPKPEEDAFIILRGALKDLDKPGP